MYVKDNSIGIQIDLFARQTGAPPAFVFRIRALFSRKGISLREDVTPYFAALEQAFRREESIRLSATQTKENLEQLQTQLVRFNKVFQDQLNRLKDLRVSFKGKSRRTERPERRRGSLGKKRGFMVPGPKEVQ